MNNLIRYIVGELLHLANSQYKTGEFYRLKSRILQTHGEWVGWDTQHIVKPSTSYGEYREFWVRLRTIRLGRRTFHEPIQKHFNLEEFEAALKIFGIRPDRHYEGYIIHEPPPYDLGIEAGWWLILFFYRSGFKEYGFGKNPTAWSLTPMLALSNLIYATRRARLRWIQIRRDHCRHTFPPGEDPWTNDVCSRCGADRWQI